jgi:transcriptional regulator with XRE-family HTH domain
MSPEDLKALRQELGCTARDLATALGVEQETVLAWERADLFPTKRLVVAMEELRRKGPAAIPKKRRKSAPSTSPLHALADPDLWRLVRKLLAHPELRTAALALAAPYPDPADEPAP